MHDRSYSYEVRGAILEIAAQGNASIHETGLYLKKILGELEGGAYGLLVADKGTGIIPLRNDLNSFCDIIAASPKLINRLAVVVTNRVQAAAGHVLLTSFKNRKVEIRIFDDIDKGAAWLTEDGQQGDSA